MNTTARIDLMTSDAGAREWLSSEHAWMPVVREGRCNDGMREQKERRTVRAS